MPQCRMSQCRKATVQNGRGAEMGNVPNVLNSRVTEWHDVTTRNNQLNKQLKDIMKIQYYSILIEYSNKITNNIIETNYYDDRFWIFIIR